ncbi:hypothetical protein, partial [Staphylococcus delphini]|uniref:hypothetical protein n=1 Tax=Staphylococcus delphini TaxID=53344 RepID=UPI001E2B08DE
KVKRRLSAVCTPPLRSVNLLGNLTSNTGNRGQVDEIKKTNSIHFLYPIRPHFSTDLKTLISY